MSISVTCVCGRLFEAEDDQAGKTIQCPECGRVVTVPSTALIVQPISLPPARSWKAIGALLMGLASAVLWVYDPMPALLVGVGSVLLAAVAVLEVWRSHGRARGQGLALGGITASIVGVVLIGPVADRIKEVSAMTD